MQVNTTQGGSNLGIYGLINSIDLCGLMNLNGTQVKTGTQIPVVTVNTTHSGAKKGK